MLATMILRSAPMACLGGRSPYEVVTGLKPRLPQTMYTGIPVEERGVNEYVKDLITHLNEVHSSVQRTTLQAIERDESTLAGRINSELFVGDPVLVKREATVRREGPTRFRTRVYEGVYVIVRKVSPGTFVVGDLVDKDYVCPFKQPVSAERLVKLDMPELELEPGQPRRLELRETLQDDWGQYTIEKFGADSLVLNHGPATHAPMSS